MPEFSHSVPGPTLCSGSERSPPALAVNGESLLLYRFDLFGMKIHSNGLESYDHVRICEARA